MASALTLPGDSEFDWWLSQPPAFWRHKANEVGDQVAYVADVETGLLRPVGASELIDYLESGEYDDRMDAIGEDIEAI